MAGFSNPADPVILVQELFKAAFHARPAALNHIAWVDNTVYEP